MPEESGGERTLPASPLKRQRARERGNVAKSQDLNAAISMLVALIAMRMLAPMMFQYMVEATRHYIMDANEMPVETGSAVQAGVDIVYHLARVAAPFLVVMLIGGLAVNLVQVGFLFAPETLTPRFERLNPFTNFQKFFSVRSFVELVKSAAKLVLISYVVYITLRGMWEQFMVLSYLTPLAIAKTIGDLVFLVWFRVVLVMLVLGILDYAFQRWEYEKDLRMTVQEAREELKELEGDPRIRQRVRQIQRQMAMQRMMAEVPKADVVITNPTTYAVALRYDLSDMDAPVVTAKGARLLADRIREIAVEHHVPIVEKPELARTVYRTVELSQPVPESLYRAVAEVLSFVYEIDRRAEKIQERATFLSATRPGSDWARRERESRAAIAV